MGNNIKAGSGIELDRIELPDLPGLNDDDDDSAKRQVISSQQVSQLIVNTSQYSGDRENYEQVRLSHILDDLDKKMKSGKFLHTFTAQVEEINRVIKMKYASTRDIASVILKDVALASRVLSIVNSCYYGQFSQKGISSIPEAMVILGTEEVQQAAATLLLFEFMRDISKSEMLKEKSLASLMRGMMAKELAQGAKYKAPDEFQLVAMLYDIGEQIILFCDPEAYQKIRRISEQKQVDMEAVSRKFIGASFSQIGSGITAGWGFPQTIVDCIKPFKEFNMNPSSLTSQNLKRLVASFTNELANIDWRISESMRKRKLEDIIKRYGHFLDVGMAAADGLLSNALEKVENHAKVLKISLRNSRFDRSAVEPSADLNVASAENLWTTSQIVPEGMAEGVRQISDNNIIWIENHIKKIEKVMASSFKLSEILHLIITTIYKGFFFSKISICIMNRQSGIMAVRFVLGDASEKFSKDFKFTVSDSDDTFNKALSTGLDIVVEDVSDKYLNSKIPNWYIEGHFAEAFAIYPLVVEQKKIGLIYVDWDKSQTHLFSDQTKHLMQRLKNLTITAIRKSRT
ncbi:MAG: HDOD domain-containing protein [Desulfamplus sp.]|nr:HDOD domain-containing protein [Desulfamplus sp.]MBF0413091.1 HDOD domain-containing protein [Desulfamplus sp.]